MAEYNITRFTIEFKHVYSPAYYTIAFPGATTNVLLLIAFIMQGSFGSKNIALICKIHLKVVYKK
jgi:hypothetical protein